MSEKLVYRSQFQAAPPAVLKRTSTDVLPTKARRGSPYRGAPRPRPVLRHTVRLTLAILSGYLLLVWIRAVTGLDLRLGFSGGWWSCGRVKTMQEWRQKYDAMELGLAGLPTSFALPSGDEIPSVGLGTWKAQPGEVGEAVKAALEAGYRHIDGAWIYGNEAEVGEALASVSSHYPRDSIFITSKLWNTFHAPEDIEPSLDQTLEKLQTTYIDLYLIHWPVAFDKESGKLDEALTDNPIKTWKKLEELVEKGKIRNIGVSNFNIRRIQNLTASDIKIKPAVNQVELNFGNPQPELVKWSKENGILLEAYSPLGGSNSVRKTLNLPVVRDIAKKLKITPAQVIISWHVQRGTVVLPKSVSSARVAENYQLFTLSSELFHQLEAAATSHPPHRESDPSPRWGVDIFDDDDESGEDHHE